jgi:hypothetical protein
MRGRKRHKKALRDIVPFTDALQPLSAAHRALHDLIARLSDAAAPRRMERFTSATVPD